MNYTQTGKTNLIMSKVLNALQDYIFTSKYARWSEEKQRRETWKEAVDRVRGMMLEKYADCGIDDDINWAYDMMQKKRILGSQRALQFGGKPAMKKNARVYNCVASYADRPRFFQEFFWLLLCGCGAGFSVQKHHVAKLPSISYPEGNIITYTIPDTIEGWADSIGMLLASYFKQPLIEGWGDDLSCTVIFDYSEIRPKGSPLSSGVGKAPGPEGLRNSHEKIRALLDRQLDEGQTRLRPIDVYDICMHIADAVLSGGIRRSATIAVFSPDDMEMAEAKTGNWFEDNPQRARSNNSALLVRNKTTREEFSKLMKCVKEFGEPGFVWADSPEHIVNPCVEISFFTYDVVDEDKFSAWKKDHLNDPITCAPEKIGLKSGWQGCNLTTNNCANLRGSTIEDKKKYLLENIRASTIVGTLQAGFNDMGYLGETSENIWKREALLGVSMTGMMDNYDVVLDPSFQREAAKLCLQVNKEIAHKIGINIAARATCLKPEGTGTLILGSTAHGCHGHHYVRYLRAVQANTDETVYQFFKEHNPKACEPSVWSANQTDDVIFFPVEVPDGAKTKNQLPAIEMLKIVKSTQQNWVMAGMRKNRCAMPWLTHNVSNTVTVVNDEEWADVEKFIYDNRKYFCGVSLVPGSVDKDYQQAPNCAVYTSRQIVKEYGDAAIWTSGLIELALNAYNGNLWTACIALLNDSYNPVNDFDINTDDPNGLSLASDRLHFYKKSRRFANKYFDGDIKRLTYCMKDVFNWKRYCDLLENFSTVDYTQLTETQDNTKLEEEIACAGGACAIG